MTLHWNWGLNYIRLKKKLTKAVTVCILQMNFFFKGVKHLNLLYEESRLCIKKYFMDDNHLFIQCLRRRTQIIFSIFSWWNWHRYKPGLLSQVITFLMNFQSPFWIVVKYRDWKHRLQGLWLVARHFIPLNLFPPVKEKMNLTGLLERFK